MANVMECFDNACEYALEKFNLDSFKEKQRLALKEIVLGKDVFVVLPTGSGKSLIFQAAPLVFDHMEGKSSKSIVLVISPLVSLMKDQVNFLSSKGIKAAFLGEEQEDESIKCGVEKGEFQVIYGSPETFLSNKRWRSMLSSKVYQSNLRLVCVDEAHCISHWGFSVKKGERAFRIWFGRINEIRSLVNVPLLTLTATAMVKTRRQITKSLEMIEAVMITEFPDRKNIGFCVKVIGSDPRITLKSIIEELRIKKSQCPRIIIYCPRIRVVSSLYGVFQAELGDDMYAEDGINDPKKRLVEMYHARIDVQNKEHILNSFSEDNGCIRVLCATIAYGMGIDCKGVKTVIHYGPPHNLEAYLQESGRAGRSSEEDCKAIMLYSSIMLQHCDDSTKEYVHNDSHCRRKLLLAHFDCDSDEFEQYEQKHKCCDICQNQCTCAGDKCDFVYFNNDIQQQHSDSASPIPRERCTTTELINKLTDKLEFLKKSLNNSYLQRACKTHLPLFTPVNLLSGFGDIQVIQVVGNANKIFTLKDVYKYVDIWHPDIATDILFIINNVFGDIEFDFESEPDLFEDNFEVLDFSLWDADVEDVLSLPSGFYTAEDMHGQYNELEDTLT